MKPLTEAQRELAESCYRLAVFEAKRFASGGVAFREDERVGVAADALVRAAATYVSDRGTSFRTHAMRAVRRAMIDELRYRTRMRRRGGFVVPQPNSPESRLPERQAACDADRRLREARMAWLRSVGVESLAGRQQQAIRLFAANLDYRRTAAAMGCGQKNVNQLIRFAASKLKHVAMRSAAELVSEGCNG